VIIQMAKILAFGDSPKMNTGYGLVNRNILWYLSKNHQIYHVAWSHSEPAEKFRDNPNYNIIPPDRSLFSAGSVLNLANSLEPDYIFTSNDWYVWKPILQEIDYIEPRPKLVSYSIIDGPFASQCYEEYIKKIDIPVVATKFAQAEMKIIGLDIPVIPHGVNSDTFKILDKNSCKEELGLHNLFVYGSVNRNIWRKNIPALLQAFSIVKDKYQDSVLFLVTGVNDEAGSDLIKYARMLNLSISNDITKIPDVLIHPKYGNLIENLTREELVKSYNAMDCFVSTSMGEGFGLTQLEALSCGIPVILPNNSSNQEFANERGWLYDSAKYKNGFPVLIHSAFRETSYFLEIPDPYALADRMIEARQDNNSRIEYGLKGREFGKQLDWKKVVTKWDDIFK
jgi:D-inositol-3-phosphate glycosyltransferase